MTHRESLEFPKCGTIRITKLGIINLRAVDAIEDAVFSGKKGFQFGMFRDQVADKI